MAKKEQSVDVKKILLGMLGERIIAKWLRTQGADVDESLNPFDAEKDMLVNNLRCEVKTQVPFLVEDSFAVHPSQMKKILKSHRVYFLSVPPTKSVDDLAGGIFELDPSQPFNSHRRTLASGRETICIPRRQTALKKIAQIKDEKILDILKKLSTSYL